MSGEGHSKVTSAALSSLLSVTAPGTVQYLTIRQHSSLFWSSFSRFNWVAFLMSLPASGLINSWAWNGLAEISKDWVLKMNKTMQQFVVIQRIWKHLHFLIPPALRAKDCNGNKNLTMFRRGKKAFLWKKIKEKGNRSYLGMWVKRKHWSWTEWMR